MANDADRHLEEVVASYLDRLNSGERIDPVAILAENPDIGQDVVEELHAYIELASTDAPKEPLGTLGDYTLRRQIGRGGMGVVYEAWESSMDRVVALKLLPRAFALDDRAFRRFLREARTAGRLGHPNIVSVFSMGVKEDTPYYSMELVAGETLAQILSRWKKGEEEGVPRRAWPPTEVLQSPREAESTGAPPADPWLPGQAVPAPVCAFLQEPAALRSDGPTPEFCYRMARAFAGVADALHFAHSRGIIHRDIKPSNLILDREGRLRILDFGIARLEGQETVTQTGDLVGTILYMSPEQATVRRIAVDHRTDIYSLGATLYEMLTRRPPFKGRTHEDTISRILGHDPEPPCRLNRGIPRHLESIVLKCLRKDPKDRYGTAEALAQDLQRFVRGDPIEAKPQTRWERVSSRLRRHRIRLGAAAAFLLLLASVGWFAYRGQQARREATLSSYRPAILEVLRRVQAEELSVKALSREATEITWFFGRATGLISRDELRAVISARTLPPLEKAAAQLAAVAEALPERPDAYYHLARSYWLLERRAEARDALGKALRCAPGFVPAHVLSLEIEGEELDDDRFARIRSLCRDPEGWDRWWLSAHRQAREGSWNEVVPAWSKVIASGQQADPYVGCLLEAYLQRGLASFKLGNYLAAIEDLSVVCSQTAGLEPRLLLAKAHLRTRTAAHAEQAEAILQPLYEASHGDEKDEAALWISVVFESVEKHEESLAWARKIERLPLKDRIVAFLLWRAGRTGEALVAGRQAALRYPEDPLSRLTLASIVMTDVLARPGKDPGLIDELLDAAREALRLDPTAILARSLIESAEGILQEGGREGRGSDGGFQETVRVPVSAPLAGEPGRARQRVVEGSFGEVKRLPPHLHAPAESSPSVTQDGLELYFSRPVSEVRWAIHVARRASPDDPWGPAERLAELDRLGSCGGGHHVTPDGKSLYFAGGCFDEVRGSPSAIFVARRAQLGDPYPAPREAFRDPEPLQGLRGAGPSLTSDGKELYFMHNATGSAGSWDLLVAWRSDEEGPFDRVRRLDELNSDHAEIFPCISADGLTLFWSDLGDVDGSASMKPGCHGLCDIWYATRERRWDDSGESIAFGPPTCLPRPVNGPINDQTPRLSWDWPGPHAKLYFTRWGPGDYSEMWEATWHPDLTGNGLRLGGPAENTPGDGPDAAHVWNRAQKADPCAVSSCPQAELPRKPEEPKRESVPSGEHDS